MKDNKETYLPQTGHEVFKPMVLTTDEREKLALVQSIELFTWLRDNPGKSKRDFEGSFNVLAMFCFCPLCECADVSTGKSVFGINCHLCPMYCGWPMLSGKKTRECTDRGSVYMRWEGRKGSFDAQTLIDAFTLRLEEYNTKGDVHNDE